MQLATGTVLKLMDGANRHLGDLKVERTEGDLVLGDFTAQPSFSEHQKLFCDFENAVNEQALSVIDKLDQQIHRLALQIVGADNGESMQVSDTQIWSDGGISLRVCNASRPARAV